MLVGYARVSSKAQNLSLQVESLEQAGCEKIYTDKESGRKVNREGLRLALEVARDGDTLVVWKLDRLGRTAKSLIEFVTGLEERGVHFKSITDNIDTSTASGKFFFHVMASLAEMERDLLIERTKAGIAAARARGQVVGRKRKMTQSKLESAKQLLRSGADPKDVAESLEVSVPTLYRWVPASSVS